MAFIKCQYTNDYLLTSDRSSFSKMSIPIGSFLRSVMLAPPQSLIEKGSMKPLICKINDIMKPFFRKAIVYSTVTLLARFRGLSTSM